MKKYLLFSLVLFFVFCFGVAFADTFNTLPQNVRVGDMTFNLPNGYVVFSNMADGTAFCGNNSTGEIMTFVVRRSFDKDIDANSHEAIKDVAKELNSNILKIDRFEFNGRIILTTREQDNNGKVAKAYFVKDNKLYVIEFTQKPVTKYGQQVPKDSYRYNNYVEDYEQARNLLIMTINSAR